MVMSTHTSTSGFFGVLGRDVTRGEIGSFCTAHLNEIRSCTSVNDRSQEVELYDRLQCGTV